MMMMTTEKTTIKLETIPKEFQRLAEEAWTARNNAYAPYSRFRVGAAVETPDGEIFSGCNIENVSYGLTNCAERTAIFQAVAHGKTCFTRLVVCADTPEPVIPCGACLQVIREFGAESEILLVTKDGRWKKLTLKDLLPYSFQDFPQMDE